MAEDHETKVLLGQALENAKSAVGLDYAWDFQNAIRFYRTSCALLDQVIDRTPASDDQAKLGVIKATYLNRIQELETDVETAQVNGNIRLEPSSDSWSIHDSLAVGEKHEVLPQWHHNGCEQGSRRSRSSRRTPLLALTIFIFLVWNIYSFCTPYQPFEIPAPYRKEHSEALLPLRDIPRHLEKFQECSIHNIFSDTKLTFLSTAKPLLIGEFVSRRDRLAQALVADELDAFAVEPGYTFSYFA